MVKYFKNISKKAKITLSIAGVLVILALSTVYTTFSPKPLGSRVDFIGSTNNYYCYIILMCGSKPGISYYYATDMNPEEIVRYFENARPSDLERVQRWKNDGNLIFVDFKNNTTGESFSLYYRMDTAKQIKDFNLAPSNKPYVISIAGAEYKTALDSL